VIPLYHDFTDETVLVFGGGPVGARKARRFVREASVVVVGPEFPADDYGGAETVRAAPNPGDVAGWFDRTDPALAVAATDDEAVNEAVEAAARERGVLVNRADRAGGRDAGSVVVPATVRDGDVTVSISTGGASPALARELRKRIETEIEGAGELAAATADLRAELKARGVAPERRREAVRAAVGSPRVWKDLGTGGSKVGRTVDDVADSTLGETE
jgi:precorrin-2 dehydrogenase/sirohydrochlorin ferrochelatase